MERHAHIRKMVFFSLPVKSEKEKVQGFAGYAIRIYPPQGRKKQTETSLFAGKYQSFVQRNMSYVVYDPAKTNMNIYL